MWWSCLSKVYEDQVHDIMMIRFNAVSHKIQEEREEQQRRQHRRRRGRRRRREDVVAHKNFGNVQRVKLVFESEMEDIKGRGTNERLSSSSVLLASHNYLYLSPLPSLLLSGKSEMRCLRREQGWNKPEWNLDRRRRRTGKRTVTYKWEREREREWWSFFSISSLSLSLSLVHVLKRSYSFSLHTFSSRNVCALVSGNLCLCLCLTSISTYLFVYLCAWVSLFLFIHFQNTYNIYYVINGFIWNAPSLRLNLFLLYIVSPCRFAPLAAFI